MTVSAEPHRSFGVENRRSDVRDRESLGLTQLEEKIVIDVLTCLGVLADGHGVALCHVTTARASRYRSRLAGVTCSSTPASHCCTRRRLPTRERRCRPVAPRGTGSNAHVDSERTRRRRVGEDDDFGADDATGDAVEVEFEAQLGHFDTGKWQSILVVKETVGDRQHPRAQRIGLVGVADEIVAIGQQGERRMTTRLVHRERASDFGETEELRRRSASNSRISSARLHRRDLTSHADLVSSHDCARHVDFAVRIRGWCLVEGHERRQWLSKLSDRAVRTLAFFA